MHAIVAIDASMLQGSDTITHWHGRETYASLEMAVGGDASYYGGGDHSDARKETHASPEMVVEGDVRWV